MAQAGSDDWGLKNLSSVLAAHELVLAAHESVLAAHESVLVAVLRIRSIFDRIRIRLFGPDPDPGLYILYQYYFLI